MALRAQGNQAKGTIASVEEPRALGAVAGGGIDRRAFDGLYRAQVGAIYDFCYRRLGSVPAAEDATQ
jgi:hypothetical protein